MAGRTPSAGTQAGSGARPLRDTGPRSPLGPRPPRASVLVSLPWSWEPPAVGMTPLPASCSGQNSEPRRSLKPGRVHRARPSSSRDAAGRHPTWPHRGSPCSPRLLHRQPPSLTLQPPLPALPYEPRTVNFPPPCVSSSPHFLPPARTLLGLPQAPRPGGPPRRPDRPARLLPTCPRGPLQERKPGAGATGKQPSGRGGPQTSSPCSWSTPTAA